MSVVSFKAGCSGALARQRATRGGRPSLELQPTQTAVSSLSSPSGGQTRYQQRPCGWNRPERVVHRNNWRQHRCRAAVKAAEGALQQGSLQPGLLISYRKDDKHILALVEAADGKKNWWIVDQRGRRFSLPGRTVSLILPGSNYSLADVQRLTDAAAAADMSMLELAWSIAVEDIRSYSLAEMGGVLFGDDTALSQYVTFCMMLHDEVFFKTAFKAGVWSFQPRDEAAVEAAKAVAEAEAAAKAARLAFREDWNAARAAATKQRPSNTAAVQQAWRDGPHGERVAALMEFALSSPGKCGEASELLARDTLILFGKRPEPDVAAAVLAEVGLLRRHEPLPLLRIGRSMGDFDPAVEAAAQAVLSSPPPDPDAATRLDLTHLTVFTVDDVSTTEVDDGLSVETDEAGNILLWVHVADPTRWITPGDVLDVEARARSRSLYCPWGSVPMFPRGLAEGPFSLSSSSAGSASETQDMQSCCAFSMCASLAADGSLGKLVSLGPSTIRVTRRLTYDEADEDLSKGPGMCQFELLQLIYEAARLRRAWRLSRGCIDIDLPEAKLEVPPEQLDEAVPHVTCTKLFQWESAARVMVAEMMILAGEAVGSLGAAQAVPLPYRGQEAPQLPSQEVLDALPDGPCKGYALRRCMTRSVIEASPVRHASLALDAYVQFTSPIRRYSDILAHFNLKAHLRGEAVPFSASAIQSITAAAGETSRELGRAEGEVTKYWVAQYLRQHMRDTWAATVLGWLKPEMQLAAVTLEDLGLETVVKVEFPVAPGDRLLLRLADVDVHTGYYRMYVHDRVASPGTSEDRFDEQLTQELMLGLSEEAEPTDPDEAEVQSAWGEEDAEQEEHRGHVSWQSSPASLPALPESPSSSSMSSSIRSEMLSGSFTSSEPGSELQFSLPSSSMEGTGQQTQGGVAVLQ